MAFTSPTQNPWLLPGAPPPPGTAPNFENPPTLRAATLGVASMLIIINTGFVGCSIISRWKELKFKDYNTLLAFMLVLGFSGLVIHLIPWARHQWDLPLASLNVHWQKVLLASEYFQSPTPMVAKLSILLLYLQFFKMHRPTRIAAYIGIVFNFLIYLPHIPIAAVLCSPAPGQPWGLEVDVKCGRSVVWGPIQGTLALVEDIYIFILPIPVLVGLNMNSQKKIGTLLIFGTALFGIAASAVGLVYRVFLWKQTRIDVTWYTAAIYICMLVEDHVAIAVSVMPHVAGFIRKQSEENKPFYRFYHSTISLLASVRPKNSLATLRKVPSDTSHERKPPVPMTGKARSESLDFLNDQNRSFETHGQHNDLERGHGNSASTTPLPANRIMKSVELRQTTQNIDPQLRSDHV